VTLYLESLPSITPATLSVGGVNIGTVGVNSSISDFTLPFICPAGLKWKVATAGSFSLWSHELPL
jgi:hypothetical protein